MKQGQLKHLVVKTATGLLGPRRVQRMLLARNFRAYEAAGVIFVHVPKAAGSTISALLYGRSLGHFTAAEMAAHDAAAFGRLTSFAVLRDPVERARSAWAYIRSGGTAEGWAAQRPEYDLPEFQSFERFATEWLPGRPVADLDYVFQPQTRFVCDGGAVLVDRLFRLDRPQALSAFLAEHIGTGTGTGTDTALDQSRSRNRNTENRGEVSDLAREALSETYADDLRLFSSITDS